jgi:DNA-binding transcriptional regulator YdaS (Cro superfamily)
MRLGDYLDKNDISAYDFATQLANWLGVRRVPFQSVYKWLDGSRKPRKYASAIFAITKGQVTPNDFIELPDLNQINHSVKQVNKSSAKRGGA